LLLEGLENRRLLAGDLMSSMHDESAMVAMAEHDHSGAVHTHQQCSAHADDASKATEHCAALSLAAPENATHKVVASGDWSEVAVWENASLPTNGSHIYVPAGTTLTIDGVIGETIQTLRIDGTLRFDPTVNTELRVDTLIGSPTSVFEMGTPEAPIHANVTARIVVADTGAIDRVADPYALGRGLVLHGTSRIHGAEKTPWTSALGVLGVGDTTLELAQVPTGWNVGDTLVIAGTNSDATGDEVVTISQIDRATITLEQSLSFDHLPARADFEVHIANTTRNAVIESENPEVQRRGHLMFMHSRDVQIAYGGFYDLGRTNKLEIVDDAVVDEAGNLEADTGTNVRGRYSVHFHRNGVTADSPPATVVGSAVVGSPGWGYVNHSSYVEMTNNVSYDVSGAAFNTEAGDEIGSFVDNLSIKTHGTGGSPVERQGDQDFGHAGDGFWFQGPGVTIEGNVAAGATGSGLIMYADGLIQEGIGKVSFLAKNLSDPSLANGSGTVPVVLTPIKSFKGNTAYGSTEGLRMYYHRTLIQLEESEVEQLEQYKWQFPNSVVEGNTAWNNATGVRLNYTLDTTFRDLTIVNSADQLGEVGFDVENVYNRGQHTYDNFTVEGFATGVIPSPNGDVKIDGGTFNNGVDFRVLEPRQTHRRMEFAGDIRFGDLAGVETGDGFIERQNIVMDADPRVVVDSFSNWFLLNDRVILNFGKYSAEQLYFTEQAADHVLFIEQPEQATPHDPGPEVDEAFIGVTNSELQAQVHSSFGGNLLPSDAVDAPNDGIVGMIGTATPDPGPLPDPEGDVLDDEGECEEGDKCHEEPEDCELDEDDDSMNEDELDEEEMTDDEDESNEEEEEPDEESDDVADEEEPDEEQPAGDDDEDIDQDDDESEDDSVEIDDSEGEHDESCEGESGEEDDEGSVEEDDMEDSDESDGDESENGEVTDIFPVTATLIGTAESEKLQGFESDDVITGGGGPDLFPLTAGNDVITDFNPLEDMIDVGDFARPSDDFAILISLEAIAANSTQSTIDGQTALVIDVDGTLGDSTTAVIGITITDLDASNVFFGVGDTSIPPLAFTHIPATTVTLNDGTVASFAGHDLSVHPLPFELVSGNQASVDTLNGVASVGDDEEDEGQDGADSDGEEEATDENCDAEDAVTDTDDEDLEDSFGDDSEGDEVESDEPEESDDEDADTAGEIDETDVEESDEQDDDGEEVEDDDEDLTDEDATEVDDGDLGEGGQAADIADDETEESETHHLHNRMRPTDVNNDGSTSPIDALTVINFLNSHSSGLLRAIAQLLTDYLDVNADGAVSPVDVLQIINHLAEDSSSERKNERVGAVNASTSPSASKRLELAPQPKDLPITIGSDDSASTQFIVQDSHVSESVFMEYEMEGTIDDELLSALSESHREI
jgi:hypothetical protein